MPILAGAIVDAADFNTQRVRFRKKLAAQSVTNSTTLVNDDTFSWSLDAGKYFRIECTLGVSGPAAADFKMAWASTGGIGLYVFRHSLGPATSISDATSGSQRASAGHALATTILYGLDGSVNSSIREEFVVETATANAAGTLTLQWAQNAANATAVQVTTSSFMVITEVDLA